MKRKQSKNPQSHIDNVIQAFGGGSALARLLEISPSAVTQWKAKGIPKARLMYLRLLKPSAFSTTRHKTDNRR